ncbi:MAG: hypothetical protein IH851_01210 [Armatimonadetes bacterium]|nr:hypothetical protein [Armatimonadota bacterium]
MNGRDMPPELRQSHLEAIDHALKYVPMYKFGRILAKDDKEDVHGIAILRALKNPFDERKGMLTTWASMTVKYACQEFFQQEHEIRAKILAGLDFALQERRKIAAKRRYVWLYEGERPIGGLPRKIGWWQFEVKYPILREFIRIDTMMYLVRRRRGYGFFITFGGGDPQDFDEHLFDVCERFTQAIANAMLWYFESKAWRELSESQKAVVKEIRWDRTRLTIQRRLRLDRDELLKKFHELKGKGFLVCERDSDRLYALSENREPWEAWDTQQDRYYVVFVPLFRSWNKKYSWRALAAAIDLRERGQDPNDETAIFRLVCDKAQADLHEDAKRRLRIVVHREPRLAKGLTDDEVEVMLAKVKAKDLIFRAFDEPMPVRDALVELARR